jgi:hypothetical protein
MLQYLNNFRNIQNSTFFVHLKQSSKMQIKLKDKKQDSTANSNF